MSRLAGTAGGRSRSAWAAHPPRGCWGRRQRRPQGPPQPGGSERYRPACGLGCEGRPAPSPSQPQRPAAGNYPPWKVRVVDPARDPRNGLAPPDISGAAGGEDHTDRSRPSAYTFVHVLRLSISSMMRCNRRAHGRSRFHRVTARGRHRRLLAAVVAPATWFGSRLTGRCKTFIILDPCRAAGATRRNRLPRSVASMAGIATRTLVPTIRASRSRAAGVGVARIAAAGRLRCAA